AGRVRGVEVLRRVTVVGGRGAGVDGAALQVRSGIAAGAIVEAGVVAVVGRGDQRVRVAASVLLDRPAGHDTAVGTGDLLPVERPDRTVEGRVDHVDVVADTVLTGDLTVVRVRVADLLVDRADGRDRVLVLHLGAVLRDGPVLVAEHLVVLAVDGDTLRLPRVVVGADLACAVVPHDVDAVER